MPECGNSKTAQKLLAVNGTALKKSERHKRQTKLCSKPVKIPYGCWNCRHFLSFHMPMRCLLTYELSLGCGVSTYRFTLNLFSRSATYIFQCKLVVNIKKWVDINKYKYVCIKLVHACWEN